MWVLGVMSRVKGEDPQTTGLTNGGFTRYRMRVESQQIRVLVGDLETYQMEDQDRR